MKNLLSKELKTEIDNLLIKLLKNGVNSRNKQTPNLEKEAFRICETLELIKPLSKPNQYKLSKEGFVVLNSNGIDKYLKNLSELERIENKIQNLTIKDLKGNIFHNKNWWWFIFINFIISILIVIIDSALSK